MKVLFFLFIFFFFCVFVSVNKGEVSVTLRQVTNLAPFAQVVVYTVMPSGEAVADSHNFPIQLCLNNKVQLQSSVMTPCHGRFLDMQSNGGKKVTTDLPLCGGAGFSEVLLAAGASSREDHAQRAGSPRLPVLRQSHRPERSAAAGRAGAHCPLCTSHK